MNPSDRPTPPTSLLNPCAPFSLSSSSLITHHTHTSHIHTDPNLLDTLEAYDGSPNFLATLDLDRDALTKAIIGTMGDIDAYQLPDAKGYAAFSRCVCWGVFGGGGG